MLAYADESGMGRILRAVLGRKVATTRAETVFTAHLASVLRSMALDGRGIAWLPRTLVAEDIEAHRLAVAADAAWTVELDVRLYRRREAMSRAAEAFWAAANQCAR